MLGKSSVEQPDRGRQGIRTSGRRRRGFLHLAFEGRFLTAHLQGEDATRFRTDYDAIRQQFPAWKPDQTLAQLWDQGGYSWLAAQEAD